jgi:antitoxin (DNA-binding transcriptional repressor) of toxin-antitoxin stability system
MLYELDIEEAPARFAEAMATVDAGLGVLLRRAGVVIARIVPESAFASLDAEPDPSDGLTPEEREMRDILEAFDDQMYDRF